MGDGSIACVGRSVVRWRGSAGEGDIEIDHEGVLCCYLVDVL